MKQSLRNFKDSYFFYSFKRDKIAVVSFAILLVLMIVSFSAPLLAPYNPYDSETIDILNSELPPAWMDGGSSTFLLGTDQQGRDLLSTMMYGMRLSVLIGLGAVVLQAFLGITVGLFAGYLGGRLDNFLMRMADIQLSFATMMVAILISAIFQTVFGESRYNDLAVPLLVVIIGIAEWPQYARTVRASVLGEKGKEYVEAARVVGLSRMRIMFRHILPNTMSSVLVISTVQVANAIMSEAALSFLGLGMPVNRPSLGSLINAGFEYIFSGVWWITLFPGLFLVVLVLVINLLGDWLRDVLNPKLYKG
ncbi:ABC transporter permease [Desulfoluna spongiiphila]|uniref:Peptide/nickel transport system permease protein n=1 Tax=Desulfoluna spongiiphila TaxID=419481 RepID=A0A1G5F2P3_9BACT|nr:ABC transporter permease [Desulfoluna spongiiphila]SCY32898.1 peptide/nickel transport system permease protein [Desulfoluna spongiiphila]VVS94388.1 abc transporter type 1 transmembrane domain meti-like [Desulfoluna spongiiphila]